MSTITIGPYLMALLRSLRAIEGHLSAEPAWFRQWREEQERHQNLDSMEAAGVPSHVLQNLREPVDIDPAAFDRADRGILEDLDAIIGKREPHDYGVDLAAGAAKSLAHREQLDRVAQQALNRHKSALAQELAQIDRERIARAYWALAKRLTRLHAGNDTAYEDQLAELFDAIGRPEHPGAPDEVKPHD